ncbi:deoxyribodipyrimidine photo-lyase [Pseudoxanthomonas sp. UTMC 1351]|uniref:deoxyribodipyrimidine photo-lyase n=1 Tax=Pseudoxanthomonas sp. UTMC 1351 TaxID=2695853 RepID=UPI0034CFF5D1
MPHALVWFRNDLRLDDNPALRAALEEGYTPIPVYIHAPEEEGDWAPGAASNAWRHHSLVALDADLLTRGSCLRVLRGPTQAALTRLIAETGAQAVYWNRKYEPITQPRDIELKKRLRGQGLHVKSFNGTLLFEPWRLTTGHGGPYKVFTPFWNAALAQWRMPECWTAPMWMPAEAAAEAETIQALRLQPRIGWDKNFWQLWQPGEAGAYEALEVFIDGALQGYHSERDYPDRVGTSRLSPHLHFGEIAPWRVVERLEQVRSAKNGADIDAYLRQLGWREFAYHLLHHFPNTPTEDFNPRFARFDWAEPDVVALAAWQRGATGVPIIDAGMRELWATGHMHNRVRMIVASFLTKHLRHHWLHGAQWFWDTLVDADLANNTLGWQWAAGTGADAAPYFRIFNPVTQAERFDIDGKYIARWVPELAAFPLPERFAPWRQPELLARVAPSYPPTPLIDLMSGRDAALAAYRKVGRAR